MSDETRFEPERVVAELNGAGVAYVIVGALGGQHPIEGERRVAPVCSLAHLRAMKAAAGRPRDLVDLAELEALHGAG